MVPEKQNKLQQITQKTRTTLRRMLPLIVGISTLLATIWLWQELEARERDQLNGKISLAAASFKIELSERMDARIQLLAQFANRWNHKADGISQAHQQNTAAILVEHSGGYEAVAQVEPSAQLKWMVPTLRAEERQTFEQMLAQCHATAIASLRRQEQNAIATCTANWAENSNIFLVYTPIVEFGEQVGFWVGAFRPQELLDALVPFLHWYDIKITEGDRSIYDSHLPEQPYPEQPYPERQYSEMRSQTETIDIHDIRWQLQVSAKPILLDADRSILPEVVLGAGIAMAILLALTTALAQTSDRRATELSKTNQELAREINQRQQAKGALQQVSQRLSFHIENSPLAVIEWDSNMCLQYWSQQAEQIFGWTAAEVLGKSWQDWPFVVEADLPLVRDVVSRLTDGTEPRNICCNRNYTQNGAVVDCQWYNSVLLDKTGNVVSILSLVLDVTDRKQAEAALQLKQFCIDRATEAIFWVRADGSFLDVNEAACQYLGYSRQELLSLTVSEINPDFPPEVWSEHWKTLKQLHSSKMETRHRTKTGRIVPVDISANHLEFQGQEYRLAFVRDITERKQAEAALRKSEERLNSILASLDDVVWSASVHTAQLLYMNPAIEQIYGYPTSKIFENPQLWTDAVHPDDRAQVKAAAKVLLEQGSQDPQYSQDQEYRIVRPSGEIRWIRERSRLIHNAAGIPIRIDGLTTDITERKQAEIALRESEERLSTMIHTNSDGLIVVDPRGTVRFANPAAEALFGRPASELLGHWLGSLYVVSELAEISILRPNGEAVITEMRVVKIQWENETAFLASLRDVTKRRQAEELLKKSEEQFRLIFELAPTGMSISSIDGRFIKVNQALCDLLGYTPEELLDRTFEMVAHPDDLVTNQTFHRKLIQGEMSHWQIEQRYLTKENRIVNAILQMALVRDARGAPSQLIGQIVDITDRKRAEEQVRRNAFYDALTDLPNRALFLDRLTRALQRSKRYGRHSAVLFLDLDHFKVINDSLGHGVGDQLLIAIARRLERCLGATDTVARMGGDEFAILLDDIQDIKIAIGAAKKIQQNLMLPFELETQAIFATVSIGIASSIVEHDRAADLLRYADLAMYRAKKAGRACHEVFNRAMHAKALERLQLEMDLRQALERQEFLVYYQPIVSLVHGQLTGFEALIRWQHPDRGLVSPAEFIPIAEETGLIMPLGQWILQKACQQLQQWKSQFPSIKLTVSVNLSGKQFAQAELLSYIDRVLRETDVAGDCLKLEITESVFIDNANAARDVLEALQSRKIKLCIDDFGMGYSSLSYLHHFPVNTLKIDRAFVSQMETSEENYEIVRTIIALAHNLGMSAIAEGIETAQQRSQLRQLGCDQGQGYWFAKPLIGSEAGSLIYKAKRW